jgi:uncharacterized membrane protein
MRIPRNWHKEHQKSLTRGERAADVLRNSMGSWGFVFSFVIFMAIWALLNSVGWLYHWDKYPFILLNLFLSMVAGLQGAILLIAAKRADAVSAAQAQHDYDTNVAAKEEIEALMTINNRQLKGIAELKALLEAHLAEHNSRNVNSKKKG